jgi:Tfp pilus assembly protein PilN
LLLLALSVAGAVICFAQLNRNSEEIEDGRSEVRQMRDEIARLKGEGEKVQQGLSPQQRELLVASHKLVANKSFGWSRLFADLEGVIPGNVSASRIAIENVYKDGDRVKAELEFAVLSRDYQAVMAMIGNMNNSGVFQAELRGQDLQKNDRQTYSEYSMRLIYTPPYAVSQETNNEVALSVQGGGNR